MLSNFTTKKNNENRCREGRSIENVFKIILHHPKKRGGGLK